MTQALRRRLRVWALLGSAIVVATLVFPAGAASAQQAEAIACPLGFRNQIYISHGSLYVSSEQGYGGNLNGMLRARATNPGPWEEFETCHDDTAFWFASGANGRLVAAELGRTGVDKGMLRARSTAVGPWERFEISRFGPSTSQFTIKAVHNGRYVSTERGYGGVRKNMLRARATAVGPWEKFLITCQLPKPPCVTPPA